MTLATNLDTLLDDALVEILTFVEVRDILALRKVCKKLRYVSMLRPVWLSALLNLVLGHGYPPYAANKPIMDMNASELEKSAIGIVRLAHRISQPTPTATRTHIFTDRLPNAYITQVLFLPGRCGRWVISVTAGQSLTFWEILDNPIGALLAGSWGDEGFILDVVTNRVPSNDGILALTHRKNGIFFTDIMGLGPSFEPGSVLDAKKIHSITPPPGRLKFLHGDFVFFHRRRTQTSTILNWKTGEQVELRVMSVEDYLAIQDSTDPLSARSLSRRCLAIDVARDHIILATEMGVYFYKIDLNSPFPSKPQFPIFIQSFDRELKAVSIQVHTPPSEVATTQQSEINEWPAISIITRVRKEQTPELDIMSHFLYPRTTPSHNMSSSDFPWISGPIRGPSSVIGSHFHSEIIAAPSGRCIWMERLPSSEGTHPGDSMREPSRSSEQLVLCDVSNRPRDEDGSLQFTMQDDMAWVPTVSSSQDILRTKHQPDLFPDAELHGTTMDYDDAHGRVVLGSFDAKIRIVDYA